MQPGRAIEEEFGATETFCVSFARQKSAMSEDTVYDVFLVELQ